jgi:hypothetical protein
MVKIKNKKAQMKIQQTAFMLIAITLFFVLVGLFFIGFKMSGVKEDATSLKAKQVKLLVSKLANSPEFSCGSSFGSQTDCVDFDKVLLLTKYSDKYKNFWGVDDIKIRKIYPKTNQDIICDISNYPNCKIVNVLEPGIVGTYESNFVSLCRKETQENIAYNKCELAILMVSYKKIQ